MCVFHVQVNGPCRESVSKRSLCSCFAAEGLRGVNVVSVFFLQPPKLPRLSRKEAAEDFMAFMAFSH